MLLGAVQKVSLFALLHLIDLDLAERARQEGCPYCGGRLHVANYERKPRGSPREIPDEYSLRLSLCCAEEGCRRRTLPPSCLFWGRRVYWAPVFLVVTTLRQQRVEGSSASKLKRMFGISHRTLLRWMAYFRQVFAETTVWKRCRERVGLWIDEQKLPSSVLMRFMAMHDEVEPALMSCLRFFLESPQPHYWRGR